jgi:hypothetical protein
LLDPASAPIPNVEVTLTNVATRTAAQTTSNAAGLFVFPIVLAGSYTIQITAAGFKRQEVTGIDITAGEIRDMGPMTLLLGEVREAVTVMDSPPAVQLASGEKSGLVSGDQLNELALKGRDFFDLMTLMPGVVDE